MIFSGQHAEVADLLQLYKPDVYAINEYGQTPVSLGEYFLHFYNGRGCHFNLLVSLVEPSLKLPLLLYLFCIGC